MAITLAQVGAKALSSDRCRFYGRIVWNVRVSRMRVRHQSARAETDIRGVHQQTRVQLQGRWIFEVSVFLKESSIAFFHEVSQRLYSAFLLDFFGHVATCYVP